MLNTAQVHAEADAAAYRGDFRVALALVTEILQSVPHDYRARLKAGLCLAALGRARDGASALLLVARSLGQRGFVLAAIGACRDALGLEPTHPGVQPALEQLYDYFGGVQGGATLRVPPPIVPTPMDEAEYDPQPEASDLIDRARAVAMTDPDAELPTPQSPKAPIPFFSDLSQSAFIELVQRIKFVKLGPRSFVVQQGEPGDSLFIIATGEVEVTQTDDSGRSQKLATLEAGQLFGEMSLLTQKPRSASVETMKPTELFEVDRSALEAVARRNPAVLEDIVRFARGRMIRNLMGTSPVFRTLNEEERLDVMQAFETRVLKPQETVIEIGQDPTGLFLILEGELESSTVDDEEQSSVLGYLREGDVVGEMSLVENVPAAANVIAVVRSVVLHLPKARFDRLSEDYPDFQSLLKEWSSQQIVDTESTAAERHVVDADELVLI